MVGVGKNKIRQARTKPGQRIYAIGDVHGRYDLLNKLLKIIISHFESAEERPDNVSLIFLGDIIDRGPSSAITLARVRQLVKAGGATMLLGNHEDMLLASLDANPAAQRAWLANGGLETLKSFGIGPPREGEDSFDFADRLLAAIPGEDVEFLRSLDTSCRNGDYLFVHAGVRPGVPLEKQDRRDHFWIRDEFTKSSQWHGAVVVHGHSIVDYVELHGNRIACDTAAYRTDRLSCVCLQDDTVTIIST